MPGKKLLRLLDEPDAARVTGGLLQLRLDLFAVSHQHPIEKLDLATAPTLIVAVEQTSGVEKQLERRERSLLQELRIHLRLQRAVEGCHGANRASMSAEVQAAAVPVLSV